MAFTFALDLSRHCVETELKRQYNRYISDYLKLKRPDESLEAPIAALEKALRHLDFSMLRSRFAVLAGNSDARVEMTVDPDGTYRFLANGDTLYEVQIH